LVVARCLWRVREKLAGEPERADFDRTVFHAVGKLGTWQAQPAEPLAFVHFVLALLLVDKEEHRASSPPHYTLIREAFNGHVSVPELPLR
jgi:hypothetical protein